MAKRKPGHKKRPSVKDAISPTVEIIKAPQRSKTSRSSGGSGSGQQMSRKKARSGTELAVPRDLSRRSAVTTYLGKLLAERDRDPVSQALVPWFCDALVPSSRTEYMQSIHNYVTFMRTQGISPLEATGDDIRLYKEAMTQAGDRPATIGRALTVLRGMYQQLGKHHLVAWDAVADIVAVKSPKVEKNTTPGLSHEQACALLNAPDLDTLVGLRDHAMIYTFFYTAFRVSAMASAKVGGLEQVDGQWLINVTEKRSKERKLELLDATGAVMRWVREAELEDYPTWPLFPAIAPDKVTVLNRPLHRDTVRKMIKRHCRKVGINPDGVIQADGRKRRGIGAHSLRKTAATESLGNKAELRDVQEWLGHASITTTQLYTMNTGEEAKRAARHVRIH